MKIGFYNANVKLFIQKKRILKNFLTHIFTTEKAELENLSFIFCSDEYLLTINKEFLAHNFFTDVITFQLQQNGSAIIGEVYISIDSVKENANLFGIPFNVELHRVIFHGVLHLCGYDDNNKKEKALMRKKEDYYLSHFFP